MHHYHLLIVLCIWYVNIFHHHINGRLQTCQGIGYLLTRAVVDLLSDDFQRIWSNAKYEPATISVHESAGRVHAVFQLTG